MNIFISGGCKNGKSMYAQKLAKEMADARGRALYYIDVYKRQRLYRLFDRGFHQDLCPETDG